MSASGILSLPEEDGIDEGNRNVEVGSGVYIGNGVRSGELGAPPLPSYCLRIPPHLRYQHHPPTNHHHHHQHHYLLR
uniref:Uncharacterized protein n=1 Tax=Tanacetum cinerariifolium TaxID=118510 RepID=A0A699WTA1_TANCI|nr:hypothetical protein [Tanacetum cinerariifolium]